MARPEQAQPRADRRASTAQPDMRTRIMSKQRKQLPEVSIFANNPFLEELLALRDSPEDEQLIEVSDTLWDLLEDVQLDARQRKFIWPDAEDLISNSPFSESRNSIRTSPVTRSRSF